MTPIDPHLLSAIPLSPFDRAVALRMFAALAQPSRLAVFLRIVAAGQVGCSARMLIDALAMTGSALTLHLRALETAELVSVRLRPREASEPLFVAHEDRCEALLGWLGGCLREGGVGGAETLRAGSSAPIVHASRQSAGGLGVHPWSETR